MKERAIAVMLLGGLTLFNAWLIIELIGLGVADWVRR